MAQTFPSAPTRAPALSTLVIRNIIVAGHRTSVRLEPVMWEALHDIARRRDVTLHAFVTAIDEQRHASSLTAAIRVYIVDFYRSASGIGCDGPEAPSDWVQPLPM